MPSAVQAETNIHCVYIVLDSWDGCCFSVSKKFSVSMLCMHARTHATPKSRKKIKWQTLKENEGPFIFPFRFYLWEWHIHIKTHVYTYTNSWWLTSWLWLTRLLACLLRFGSARFVQTLYSRWWQQFQFGIRIISSFSHSHMPHRRGTISHTLYLLFY